MSERTHETVETTPRIDSFDLWDKEDLLLVYNTNPPLWYQYEAGIDEITLIDGNDKARLTIPIRTTTGIEPQSFFICPCCGESKRFLYSIMPYYLACRKCAGLNYESQQESHLDAVGIYEAGVRFAEERLGWTEKGACPADFPLYVPAKPKGMHQVTYERIMRKFRWYQKKYEKKYYEELGRVLAQAEKERRKYERY